MWKKRNLLKGYCVYRHKKIFMSIHIIAASLSTTQLAVLGGEGGWGTKQAKACVGGEGWTACYASASGAL